MGRVSEPRDDRALLEASRADGIGFDAFYRRYRDAVLAFHAARVREPETAADLTAETFAAALLAVHDHGRELPQVPAAWLFTIAHRKLVDSYRRGRVEDDARKRLAFERIELSDDDVERVVEAAGATDLLARLAEVLRPDQLAALRARVIDGREYPDIATELRCSEVLVRMRVSRALKALRHIATEDHNG